MIWILIPAILAIGLAVLAASFIASASGNGNLPAAAAPPSPTSTADASPPTRAPEVAVAATATTAASATLTPDLEALAVLTQLPATLVDDEIIPTSIPTALPPEPPTETPVPAPPTNTPVPDQVATGPVDPLTGEAADPAKLARAPLVVMIDNHPDAAPQTGLNSASMVIEALAEGGITRFETFFLTGDAPTVGPVRSARPYFVEWAYPFKPLYVHCGGSWEAIDLIEEATGILTDVDCFNGKMPFWRSNDRLMPHNLYSSTTQLWKVAANRGLSAPEGEPVFLHSAPLPPDQRPASGSVGFTFSGLSRSDITWIYDHDSNQYLRKQWGYWHRDAATGDIINARNVVILWTNVWELPGDEKGRMGTDTVGTGTALIMRDGQYEWGYWTRKNPYAPMTLLDGKREPMHLAPGRVWFEILGIGKKVQIGQ
ncbi:MAG TPA: DUF3048 domain-containing protein [Chloroflexia bacterium]|nr:DUF3048 domain-containing protein [Chloroflexia bacterium]